jgi:hypothetical protein
MVNGNICSQFAEGKLKDLTSITTFPTKFIVEESLVKDYLERLQNLDLRTKRVHKPPAQRKRQAEREKSYDAYDCMGWAFQRRETCKIESV